VSDVFNYFKLGTYPSNLHTYSDARAGRILAKWKKTYSDLIQLCVGVPSQVQYARKKGFQELRTQAQSREYDTDVAGKEWDGYYRWARLGYQMYDTVQLKRLDELLQQGNRPEKTLGELVLSLDNDDGYKFWKTAAVNFTWDGKFELQDNSVSMNHLLKYLVKKNINNYKP